MGEQATTRGSGWLVAAEIGVILALIPALAAPPVAGRHHGLMLILLGALSVAHSRSRGSTPIWAHWVAAVPVVFLFSIARQAHWLEPAGASDMPFYSTAGIALGLAGICWIVGMLQTRRRLNEVAWSAWVAMGLLGTLLWGLYRYFGDRYLVDESAQYLIGLQGAPFAMLLMMVATVPSRSARRVGIAAGVLLVAKLVMDVLA